MARCESDGSGGGVVRLTSKEVPLFAPANEWAGLGAVAEGPTHGYAVAQMLASDGPIWAGLDARAKQCYDTLNRLMSAEMIAEMTTAPGNRGPTRILLRVTPKGRKRFQKWLAEPVDHVHDVRSLLLLKLLFLDRAGLIPNALIDAQVAQLPAVLEGFEAGLDGADSFDRVLTTWRVNCCRATLEFLAQARG
jgi:DNA-binding PadR family transcriptional regulator